MARALLGHLATATDSVILAELAGLRRRVALLESEVTRLREQASSADDAELHAELHAMMQPETV